MADNPNGELVWIPETDQKIEKLHLVCELDGDPINEILYTEQPMKETESVFTKEQVTIYHFKNCKPATKKDPIRKKTVTVDTINRIWVDGLRIKQTKVLETLNPMDRSLEPQLRIDLLSTRLNTIDLKLAEVSDQTKPQWVTAKQKTIDEIEKIKEEKDIQLSKKIFAGI